MLFFLLLPLQIFFPLLLKEPALPFFLLFQHSSLVLSLLQTLFFLLLPLQIFFPLLLKEPALPFFLLFQLSSLVLSLLQTLFFLLLPLAVFFYFHFLFNLPPDLILYLAFHLFLPFLLLASL